MPSMGEDPARDAPADLDHHVLRCLDSCHELLALRNDLSLLLRQGWMDMARARYSMGSSRISHPLFSLKPHSASAHVGLALLDDDPGSPSLMTLVRLDAAGITNSQSADSDSHTCKPERRGSRSGAAPPDWSHDEDAAYRRLMAGEGDSDSDSEAAVETQTNEQTRPLRWFGTLVSPHLQAAQTSFESALEILVKIANAQQEASHAHNQVMQQRGGMNVDEPSSPGTEVLQNSSGS
ncbi:hypothetical protein KC19_9G158600 [Ceratodon purpureus]|uniref:Vacuolar ATPase assembly protein VMA22 n=1 Tax=Ceratodon purpureus TaxID=3225 RepID=A0A8T0GWU1_CERPU|nr:hypothetical protein KC19_9G158600 [Ceratodon purpureus]